MKKTIIGIMGPAEKASNYEMKNAYILGKLIAEKGWGLLTGGRNVGVMNSSMQGAKSANGLTIGVLPDNHIKNMSHFVDIPIVTGMGNGRNNINTLSSDVVIACGIGIGTISEISLALKNNKKVILLTDNQSAITLFKRLTKNDIFIAHSPEEVINIIEYLLLITSSGI